MELDEMKLAWQALDERLAKQQALNLRLLRDQGMDRLRRGLRPLAWGQAAQIVFGVALMLWGIAFWSTHLGQWRPLACGIAMQACGTVLVCFAGKLLHALGAIDHASPVVEIQRRLAAMRAWRVRVEAPVLVLLGSFMWVPAVLMLIQNAADRAGFDFWTQSPGLPVWLLLNGAFALALVLLVYGVLRRAGRSRWLENNFVGSAIRRADGALEEIARFERD